MNRLCARTKLLAGLILGSACGLAYLTKSFMAFALPAVWAAMRWQAERLTLTRELTIAFVTAAVIGAPWSLYAGTAFPLEFSFERSYALRHITEVIENQGGPPWKYLWDYLWLLPSYRL